MQTLFREVISYGCIGLLSSGLDTLFFALFVYGFGQNEIAANFVSVIIGITCSFFLNRRFTFKLKDYIVRRYISFFAVGMCGLGLSELMISLSSTLNIEPLVIKIASIFVVAAFQFVLNKLISFRRLS